MSTATTARAPRRAAAAPTPVLDEPAPDDPARKQPADARPPHLTARNPYALAEIVLGHAVDWSDVDDPTAVLEDVLATPREQLFDPRFGSPVYLGSRLDEAGDVVDAPVPDPVDVPAPESDDAGPGAGALPDDVRTLGDLTALLGTLDAVPVRSVAPARAGGWTLEVGAGGVVGDRLRGAIFDKDVIGRLVDLVWFDRGWTPPGAQWVDRGAFFSEAAEFFDPVQGGLGDCWLIAAMSSVAWALPGQIADASRATGPGNQQFTHTFRYRDPDDGSQRTFEASDETLVWSGTTSPLYARSSEPGEIWPGVIEKAFAQWRQGTTNDHPNLTVLNGGDPVWASAALSGRTPQYHGHGGATAASLRTLVKSHSVSYRTVDPMTAWTYDTAPAGLSYADATIVGNHAYSVLGWTSGTVLVRAFESLVARTSGPRRERLVAQAPTILDPIVLTRDYVVLRNPWGSTEATLGARHGAIVMHDKDFWRTIDLDVPDGVFAIDFSTYQRYFAGTGVAV